jgi:hypothetical protein
METELKKACRSIATSSLPACVFAHSDSKVIDEIVFFLATIAKISEENCSDFSPICYF